ncbi:MAG: hypothetical protein GY807_24295 [Gammaproteobacteria bacterium]|nr:hypothetical protein [Gammaproteobacteria bacterium]
MKLTRHQLLLGDDHFIAQHKKVQKPESLRDVSKAQRRTFALTLDEYKRRHEKRDEAMARAYNSGTYTMKEIGKHFGVHAVTVGRAVRKYEQR